jgi:hypothetical protein
MRKIQGSAILIALAIGLLISGIVFALSASVSQRGQTADQARQGKQAYAAAASGIEDGLLRYKYAQSQNNINGLLSDLVTPEPVTFPNFSNLPNNQPVSYDLSIENQSLGAPLETWPNSSTFTEGTKLNADETIDLNLAKIGTAENNLASITIYFSNPYFVSGSDISAVPDAFSALNYQLFDARSAVAAEQQSLSQKTNTQVGVYYMTVDLSACTTGSNCHLKIKSQVASKSQAFNPATKRLVGTGSNISGKFVFYALKATFQNGTSAQTAGAKIGTIKITSVGKVGASARKLEATIDASNGAFLGLFDYGVYCGKECSGS